jgi:hypothetical protein
VLQKFVYVTGALDYLIGIGLWAKALSEMQPGTFVGDITMGTFLMMAAACLIWASKDMATRAPVIFWQGLVRLSASCAVLYAVPAGLSQPWEYALVAFDGTIGLTYVIGMARVTGCSPLELLQCKTAPGTQAG